MSTSEQTVLGLPSALSCFGPNLSSCIFSCPVLRLHRHSSPMLFSCPARSGRVTFLYKNESFRNEFFLNKKGWIRDLPRILRLFAGTALILLLFTALVYPQSLFACPRNHFSIWLWLMVVYPLLAVYPQELILPRLSLSSLR